MKNVKKTLSIFIAAIILVMATGCGGSANVKLSDTNYVFTQKEIEIPGTYDQVSDNVYLGGKFYLLALSSEMTFMPIPEGMDASMFRNPNGDNKASDGSEIPEGMYESSIQHTWLLEVDENGNITKEKELSVSGNTDPNAENFYYDSLFVSPDGKLLTRKTSFSETGNKTILIAIDENLNETEYFNLTAAMETIPQSVQVERRNSPREFVFDDTYAYALTYEGLIVFETATGKYQFSLLTQQSGGNSFEREYLQGIYNIGGTVVVSISRNFEEDGEYKNETFLKVVDPKTQAYGAEYDFAGGTYSNALPGNDEYPIILASGAELYSYNYLTGEKTLLIDFLASGTTISDYNNVAVMGDNRYAIVTTKWNMVPTGLGSYSGSTSKTSIIIFEKVDPSLVKQRKLITISTFYTDSELLEFAADFNKKNTEYEITINSYYDTATDNSYDAVTALNNDIISGNIPDILIISSGMPYDSYASKGLFYDINKYLEKDDTINKETLNPYVLKALETDGKLYSITKSFSVNALTGKKSVFGDTPKLTTTKIDETLAAYPEAALMGNTTQGDFINILVSSQLSSFINSETGEVSFNSPEFIDLLNIAKTLPGDDPNGNAAIDYDDYQTMFTDNRALILTAYVYDFRSLKTTEYQNFGGEEITVMGYPNPNNSGIMLSPSAEMAIMSKGNTDAAFEVIKNYLLFEPTDTRYGYGLPIINEKLNAAAAAATKPMTYTDPETGEIKEAANTFWTGSGEVTIPDNTEADNQIIFDLISNIGGISRYDNELMKIIEEETAAFFAGSKTAEECAKLIDNRAATYIAEAG
ncbi:MAG: hypothetical protein LBL87_03790 [Ruminococcus sp.]|nr:hypothetical protein [Ruminococcus sp.]